MTRFARPEAPLLKQRYPSRLTPTFDVKDGGSCRIRTCDQLIKSQLLYQLS